MQHALFSSKFLGSRKYKLRCNKSCEKKKKNFFSSYFVSSNMSIRTMATRSLNALPNLPTKFTKALPGDIYTTNVTEDNKTNLMRTPRPVHGAVYSHVYPETAPDPIVLAISKPACQEIDLDIAQQEEFATVFSGNKILTGTRPWSLCYAGHQFG